MKAEQIAPRIRALMAHDDDLKFQSAEVAADADTEDELRHGAELAGWFDSGKQFSTLKTYRTAGRAWQRPDGTFAWVKDVALVGKDPWSIHAEMATGPLVDHLTADERVALIKQYVAEHGKRVTKRIARDVLAGKKPMKDDHNNPAAALKSIIEGDLALDDVSDDPEVVTALRRFMADVEETVASKRKKATRKAAREMVDDGESMEAAAAFDALARAASRDLRLLMDSTLTDGDRARIVKRAEEIKRVMDWVIEHVASGTRSFEDELSDLLA